MAFECAKAERHATSKQVNPNRNDPTRLSFALYAHRNLEGGGGHLEDEVERDEILLQQLQECARVEISGMFKLRA